jgi:hypothetical protein
MEIIIGIIAIFVVIVVIGKIKGPPNPKTMSIEAILARMQSEGLWMARYEALPYENQQNAGLKKMCAEKKLYLMELQLELVTRGSEPGKTLAPALQRTFELVRGGMTEEEAKAQAIKEFVENRDAATSKSST